MYLKYLNIFCYSTCLLGLNCQNNIIVHFILALKDEESSKSENNEYLNDAYSIQTMMDSCSDFIHFLVEEERNKTVIQNEAKEVKMFF